MLGNLKWQGRALVVVAAAMLVSGGVVAGIAVTELHPPPLGLRNVVRQEGFAELVATVKPAVVNISTTQQVKRPALGPLADNGQFGDMLKQFLGPNADQLLRESNRPIHALGSGFIIDPAGYIVTNNHVIDDATEIKVTLSDGSLHSARIIGRDAKTDIALLKIDAVGPLPYVAFGDSDKEQVGDWVIAVGNPYGLGGSVSAGIISGSKRDINEGPYDDFLQIDAPINPGNSGGPLFDQSGRVIGIDTAIYTPSGGSVGIGFAIPSNVAEHVIAELRQNGHVSRGWIGVQMQELTPALARAIGFGGTGGVLVDAVTPAAPAARAGVRQGDVITRFGNTRITSARDLAFAVADASSGRTVPVTIWRDGHEQNLDITVKTQNTQNLASLAVEQTRAPVGLRLATLPRDEGEQIGVLGGAVVQSVTPGSNADQSGLQAGDIILRIGTHAIRSAQDAASWIHDAEAANKTSLPLLVLRDGTTSFFALELGSVTG